MWQLHDGSTREYWGTLPIRKQCEDLVAAIPVSASVLIRCVFQTCEAIAEDAAALRQQFELKVGKCHPLLIFFHDGAFYANFFQINFGLRKCFLILDWSNQNTE